MSRRRACCENEPDWQKIVAEAVVSMTNQKYVLDCFIIMPNPCMAIWLVPQRLSISMSVGQSWERYTRPRDQTSLNAMQRAFCKPTPFRPHQIRSRPSNSALPNVLTFEKNPEAANLPKNATHYWTQGL